jgi:hypothetical protein
LYARKVDGFTSPLSPEEETWLETVIRVLLRRSGERYHDPSAALTPITSANLHSFP